MAEERIAAFEKKFDELDNKKDGLMKPEEFFYLYKELEGKECTREESDVMFRGIDIDGSGEVSKEEYMDLVKAIVNDDKMYIYKLVFRAFDKDRSRSLEKDEVMDAAKYMGKEMTKEEAEEFITKKTGKKNGKITFAMLYNLITGKTLPDDFDAYDGKLKSGCCLLI